MYVCMHINIYASFCVRRYFCVLCVFVHVDCVCAFACILMCANYHHDPVRIMPLVLAYIWAAYGPGGSMLHCLLLFFMSMSMNVFVYFGAHVHITGPANGKSSPSAAFSAD